MRRLQVFKNLKTRLKWWRKALALKKRTQDFRKYGNYGMGLVSRSKHGIFLVSPEDNYVGRHLLKEGSYGDKTLELIRSLCRETSSILVVGAHIGSIAIPLGRYVERVLAVEANPESFELLQLNILINESRNVIPLHFAAAENSGAVKFLLNRDNSGGSKIVPRCEKVDYYYDNPRVIEVESRPIDNLELASPGLDLILMDIEGSEYSALKGMQRTLAMSNILMIEFAYHHLSDVAGVSPERFVETLAPHFSFLFIPTKNKIVPNKDFSIALRSMYDRREYHSEILFFKDFPAHLEDSSVGIKRSS